MSIEAGNVPTATGGNDGPPGHSIAFIEITGLRGFAQTHRLELAVPNGLRGSGLTILLGPNNAGKSTIVEAFRAMTRHEPFSFPEGQRNRRSDNRIAIRVRMHSGVAKELRSVEPGSSETEWDPGPDEPPKPDRFYVLPSRRTFRPFFHKNADRTRSTYITGFQLPDFRGSSLDNFGTRLFEARRRRTEFDPILHRVAPMIDWTIERSDTGQYYLKLRRDGSYHNSDGLGEGLVSTMFIVDALYDSSEEDIVVIDEPELSLHPSLQKSLFKLLAEYAARMQIIYATHSPYFVDWKSIIDGCRIARVHASEDGTVTSSITRKTVDRFSGLLTNRNNPHILGLDAREVFFLQDGVILVEGQDDVSAYARIADQLQLDMKGEFYGWGVGGAGNMETIAQMLRELGFRKVAGILDGNQRQVCANLAAEFPEFRFFTIPMDDVRDKLGRQETLPTEGLLGRDQRLRPEHRSAVRRLFAEVNSFLA